jgi:polysaccharide biosynthesis transport protein
MTHADQRTELGRNAKPAGDFTKLIGRAPVHTRLVITSGPKKGSIVRLTQGELTIGRDALSGLCLADNAISRKQCTIQSDGGSWLFSDCNSLNGSFVNRTAVREKVLQHGDQIRLGSTELTFLEEEDELPSPSFREEDNLTRCVPVPAKRKLSQLRPANYIPGCAPEPAAPLPGVPPGEMTPALSSGSSLGQLIKAFRKRRWILLAFVCAAIGAALAVQFAAPKIYEAAALVKIERNNMGAMVGQDVSQLPSSGDMEQIISTQIALAHSELVLRPVAETYHLISSDRPPEANSGAAAKASEAPFDVKQLRIFRVPNSYLIRISYRAHDPRLAAEVANAVAQSLTAYVNDAEKKSQERLSTLVAQDMAGPRTRMEASSRKLADYEKRLRMADPSQQAATLAAHLTQLNAEFTAAQAERVRRQAILAELSGNTSLASAQNAQAASHDSLLNEAIQHLNVARQQFAQVRSFYGDAHPEYMKAQKQVEELNSQVDELRARAKERAEAEYRQAQQHESLLYTSVQQAKTEDDRLSAAAHQYDQLQSEANHDKKIYEDLSMQARIAGMNRELLQATVQIAAPARVPQLQLFPKLIINLPVALIASGILGIFFIVLLDALDSTFSDSEELARRLHLDALAAIPAAPSPKLSLHRAPEPSASGSLSDVQACFDEAIRSARTAIALASAERPIRSVLVTSALPGEGKSTLASQLALSFAQIGRRVLLVDANFRRPALQQMLHDYGATGLADVLQGKELSADAIRKSEQPGLFVMPAGPLPQRATELISIGFSRMLLKVRREFDLIIVDAPPVLGASETQELAATVDGVLVLAKANSTTAKQLSQAVSIVGKSGANLVGIVLNQVKLASAVLCSYPHYSHAASVKSAAFLGK